MSDGGDRACGCAGYYLARWPDLSPAEADMEHRGDCLVYLDKVAARMRRRAFPRRRSDRPA